MTSARALAKTALKRPYEWNLRRGAPAAFQRLYEQYWEAGEVPDEANLMLSRAIWASDGLLPRQLAHRLAPKFDVGSFADFPQGLLADLNPAEAAAALDKEGVYRAPTVLDAAAVNDLARFLDAGPAAPRVDSGEAPPSGIPSPSAPTWWMAAADSIKSPDVRALILERDPVDIVGRYLGVEPMIMSLVLWKSYAWGVADSSSAQQFHYDYDRASFLKMFVYLSDVGPDNGPHTYVRGSHLRKPTELLDGRRLTDEEVERHFPRDSWETICGPKGTVFFADTQGFHKGERVAEGSRSMLQICYASDRFGYVADPSISAPEDSPSDMRPQVLAHPRFFSEMFEPPVRIA